MADIALIEEIEEEDERGFGDSDKPVGLKSSQGARTGPERTRKRAITQMYEHGHFNFLKMYLLQDN